MDEQFNEALATLQATLQERQQRLIDNLVKYMPPGYALQYNLLKIEPSNIHYDPGCKPFKMKDALSAHAFMYVGLLPNDHRRATCIIRDEEWEMEVEDWLKQQSRYEILRFSGYGKKSLQLLIDVLKWHGYDTANLES